MEHQYDRFKDAPWFPRNEEACLIGGAGGIGSWLTFFLTKAGFKPIVYDHDTIEEHNIGGQLFRVKDIGKPKVEAISSIVKEFCGDDISTFETKVDLNSPTHHFCFSAFDNMKARKDLFEVWKRSIPGCTVIPLFIDGRLTMEQLQIFAVTPDRVAQYEEHLFDDSEVEDEACTLRQTSHTAAMIASHMTSIFTNHLTNVYERQVYRDVPFFYEFYGPVSLTNIE
jgi:hypothetical protein